MPDPSPAKPHRLLVVLPSWVGDVVMATPALRLLRDSLPGSYIGGLVRPGNDALLAGSDLLDELHVFQPNGMMASKKAAGLIRPRRYDTALLLTNSFSTALIARLAFIPRRVGYDRDARAMLLSQKLRPPRNPDGTWRITPAVNYYHAAATALLTGTLPELDTGPFTRADRAPLILPDDARLELSLSEKDKADAAHTLALAGVSADEPTAILNPGGNNPAKRWPADRFAQLADRLARTHNLRVLINGSPSELDLCREIASLAQTEPVVLAEHEHSLSGLKALCAQTRLMLTNDTGPRHIAAAFGVPLVSLFGPTDARWTTIPHDLETILLADPTLEPKESANDHAERCRVDRIETETVIEAVEALLAD
ncbi:MAG: heptosyltransferase-2 [Phycisphaerales bacterium]|jgi:heptosyltransferase-2